MSDTPIICQLGHTTTVQGKVPLVGGPHDGHECSTALSFIDEKVFFGDHPYRLHIEGDVAEFRYIQT